MLCPQRVHKSNDGHIPLPAQTLRGGGQARGTDGSCQRKEEMRLGCLPRNDPWSGHTGQQSLIQLPRNQVQRWILVEQVYGEGIRNITHEG